MWVLLFLSLFSPIIGMGTQSNKKKIKFNYSLANAFNRSDPDKPDFPIFTMQATPMQFERIKTMSDTFAHHVQDESVDLDAQVQHLFNKLQFVEHHKKPSQSHEDITRLLQIQIKECRNKLLEAFAELTDIETGSGNKYTHLDLLEKKIVALSREFMTLSHTHQLHCLYTTKKRIEKVKQRQMKTRLQSLFYLLEMSKEQDIEIRP